MPLKGIRKRLTLTLFKPNKKNIGTRRCLIYFNPLRTCHCVKSDRIWSFSGLHFPVFGLYPYSFQMQENTDQKNYEYGHLRSECFYNGQRWYERAPDTCM